MAYKATRRLTAGEVERLMVLTFGEDWREITIPTVDGLGFRLADVFAEVGLRDPKAPVYGEQGYGLWQVSPSVPSMPRDRVGDVIANARVAFRRMRVR